MKEKIEKIIFIFASSLIVIGTSLFTLKKPLAFSENENRYLQQFPRLSVTNLINGRLVSDIEDYINDQFPYRDTLVGLKTQVDILLGKTKINDIYISEDGYLIPAFIKRNDTKKIIDTLNSFVKSNEVSVDLMLVPNSIEIYRDKLPINDETNDGLKEIQYIYNSFLGNTIDVTKSFLKVKDSINLYYKTDHHWTTYGAFYAYEQYLRSQRLPLKSLSNYRIKEVTNSFYGTSYSKANYYNIEADKIYLFEDYNHYFVNYIVENKTETSLYNYDYLNKKDKYSIFLDNNHALIEIENLNSISQDNLLLIKNSYGNSFAPFIAADYKKTSVIDLRYYKGDVTTYIKDNNITKVLILYDINGIYTDSSIFKLK